MDLLERNATDQKSWFGFSQRNAPLVNENISFLILEVCSVVSRQGHLMWNATLRLLTASLLLAMGSTGCSRSINLVSFHSGLCPVPLACSETAEFWVRASRISLSCSFILTFLSCFKTWFLKPLVLNWASSQLFDYLTIEFDPLCRSVRVVQNRTV